MTTDNTFTRRTVLGLGALAFAGVGAATFAPRVAAQGVVVDSYTAESKSFTTDNGLLAYLVVSTDYAFSWNGFDSGAKSATVRLYATVGASGETLVASDTVSDVSGYSGGPVSGSLPDADLVALFGSDAFADDSEDESYEDTDVDLRLEVEVFTYAGSHTGDKSATMTVSVMNETAAVSAGAESTVDGAEETAPIVYEMDGLVLSVQGTMATLALPTGAFTADSDSTQFPNHGEVFVGDASGNWTGQLRYATGDSSSPTIEGISYQPKGGSWTTTVPAGYTATRDGDSLVVTFPETVESIGAAYTPVDSSGSGPNKYVSENGGAPWSTGNLIPL